MKAIIADDECVKALADLDQRVSKDGLLMDTWLWQKHVREGRVIIGQDDNGIARAYALLEFRPKQIFISRLEYETGFEPALVPLMEKVVKLAEQKNKCLRAWTDNSESFEMTLFQLFNFQAELPQVKSKSKRIISMIYRPA